MYPSTDKYRMNIGMVGMVEEGRIDEEEGREGGEEKSIVYYNSNV